VSTVVIEVSDLRSYEGDYVQDLADFLEKRLSVNVDSAKNEVTLEFEEEKEAPSRSYLRLLLRKFLHREELKEVLRVISGGENTFIIKERKEVPE
jgi:hypothetical protein